MWYSVLIAEEITNDREKDIQMLLELRRRNRWNGNVVRTIDRYLLVFLTGERREEFVGHLFSEVHASHREAIMVISKNLREVVREKGIRYAPPEKWPAQYGRDRIRLIHSDRKVILVLDNFYSEFLDFAMDYFRSKPNEFRSLRKKGDRIYTFHFEKERMGRFQTPPDEIDYLFTLGSALMGHGLYSYAALQFQEALKSDPDDYEALLQLSDCLRHMGQDESAIRHLKKAASINPDDGRGYLQLADRYRELGLYEMALENLLRARDLGQGDWQIHNNIGVAYAEIEEYSKAIEAYEKALEAAPEVASVRRNTGLAYQRLGQFDKAIEAYEECSELDPQNIDPYLLMGEVYEEMGNFNRAVEAYRKTVEIRPNYPAYLSLGRTHEKMKQLADARASYLEASIFYPEGKEARAQLFRLDHPDMEELNEEIDQVVKDHPFLDDPDAVPVIYEEAKRRKAEREGGKPTSKQGSETLGLN
jgi:tetratricopeptide (TPR) repeat protein